MRAIPLCVFLVFLLCRTPPAAAATADNRAGADFQREWGGYLTSSDFRVDPDRPGVILLPAAVVAGDLLRIRPLHIYSDEYLILQKCPDAACSRAQVVRAWNAYGYMGPLPVLTNTVRVEAGASYLLWLQRVPTAGNGSFKLIQPDAPPLQFMPAGSPELFHVADLKAAQEHGPVHIKKATQERAHFVVTFERGSVVQMQALRAPQSSAANAP